MVNAAVVVHTVAEPAVAESVSVEPIAAQPNVHAKLAVAEEAVAGEGAEARIGGSVVTVYSTHIRREKRTEAPKRKHADVQGKDVRPDYVK